MDAVPDTKKQAIGFMWLSTIDDTHTHMQVVNQVDELVEEGHVARDALLKIFNKKLKRSKKKDAGMSYLLQWSVSQVPGTT